jgi:AraC family transcriptional regulator, regulatory protein of adaptative response / methylated-DNA-[protein]-cysteine methyltransferase
MTDTDPRWGQVIARDHAADGTFVYAVRTTGVYCRPSCAARRAKPENVTFFTSWEEAEAAGFRPCRRCWPHAASPGEGRAEVIAAVCRRIETAEEAPSLTELAAVSGFSLSHLTRMFRAVTGVSPGDYARAHRAQKLRAELALPGARVTDAIYAAGYGSSGRFYAEADSVLGMTPTAFRNGGEDTGIRFAVGPCSLGLVLVATSTRGICAILFGDEPDALAASLRRTFPQARIAEDPEFQPVLDAVIAHVDRPEVPLALPLDIRGTAFQAKVWAALRAIPPGTTVTYAELARRLGVPGASRAVGGACAANTLAIAIPCHRVVRGDGSLSGYRWGVERKRALLERESALPDNTK